MKEVANAIGDLEEGRGGNDGEERRRLERVTVRRGRDWRALRERVTVRIEERQRECERE